MNRIKAEIIADSKNEFGQRLTTFVLKFPRVVLSEFNTHRMLSKNSASSRAIPFRKMLKKVMSEPFTPIAVQKDHSGMQGTVYYTGFKLKLIIQLWLTFRNISVAGAWILSKIGVTKQLCNRLLEPFMYHTVICTGTEWENFFALRAHPAAEIHIADLAQKMLFAYNQSIPKLLKEGEWHIPFGDKFDQVRLQKLTQDYLDKHPSESYNTYKIDEFMVQIATARCARTSYDNFDGTDDYEKDIKLYSNLHSAGHMSPFEHCAKAMSSEEYIDWRLHFPRETNRGVASGPDTRLDFENGWCGNLRGFIQLRKTLAGENKSDTRVDKA